MPSTLAPLLLAALLPASPNLELQADASGMVVRLCFTGGGQVVRFDLQMQAHGQGGTSNSRQKGQVRTSYEAQCPVRVKVGSGNAGKVRAHLRWWVDGVEQEPLDKVLQQI